MVGTIERRREAVCLLAISLVLAIGGAVVVSPTAAAGSTLVVDNSDASNYDTIQNAVDNATTDDTIRVEPGTYSETVTVNKEVEVKANGSVTLSAPTTDKGVGFDVTANDVTIRGFEVTGYNHGIRAATSRNLIVDNDVHDASQYGIYVTSGSDTRIENNSVHDNTDDGVRVKNSAGVVLEVNDVRRNGDEGVVLDGGQNNVADANDVINNTGNGVLLWSAENATVVSNNVSENDGRGIHMTNGVGKHLIENNTILGSSSTSIEVYEVNDTIIRNNSLDNDGWDGIYIQRSTNHTVAGNDITGQGVGINVDGMDDVRVRDNVVSGLSQHAVEIDSGSQNLVFRNNSIRNPGWNGFHFDNATNVTIAATDVQSADKGVYFNRTTNATLTGSTITGSATYGIHVNDSVSDLTVYDNLFNNSVNHAIRSGSYTWNTTAATGSNVVGGTAVGGNLWAKPDGSGFSQTCTDADNDGFCDSDYALDGSNTDFHALASGPVVDATPSSHDYGGVRVGTNESTSIAIENDGNDPLDITNLGLAGADPGEYNITTDPTPVVLEPGASTTVDVRFEPSSTGNFTATLQVDSNDSEQSTLDVPLSGNGTAPDISVTPTSHGFGEVSVGTSESTTVTIANDGNASINVTNLDLAGSNPGQFDVPGDPSPVTIAPGAQEALKVSFEPRSDSAFDSILRITSNDSDESPVDVALSGTGVEAPETDSENDALPNVTVSPPDHDYGYIPVGATNSTTITIANAGDDALEITNVTLVGEDIDQFNRTEDPTSLTLAPDENRTLQVRFEPNRTGRHDVMLRIESNDPDASTIDVPLTGAGEVPKLEASPFRLEYASVTVDTSDNHEISLRNEGNLTVIVSKVQITGADASAFSADETGPFEVAPGERKQLRVLFTPNDDGARWGELRLLGTDGSVLKSVALNGTGVNAVADEPDTDETPADESDGDANPDDGSDADETPADNTTYRTNAGFVSFDYKPSARTQYVGGFTSITLFLSGFSLWVFLTFNTSGAGLLSTLLGLSAVRTGSDLVRSTTSAGGDLTYILLSLAEVVEVALAWLFLLFVFRYADRFRDRKHRRRVLATAGAAVVGAALLVVTNPLHRLVFVDYAIQTEPFAHVVSSTGPLWWALLTAKVLPALAGLALLASTFVSKDVVKWRPIGILAGGVLVVVTLAVFDATGQFFPTEMNHSGPITAVFVSTSAVAVLGHGIQQLNLVARDSILDEIDDAIVLLNDDRRVADFNEAAAELFEAIEPDVPFRALFEDEARHDTLDFPVAGSRTNEQVSLVVDGTERHFMTQIRPITTATATPVGYTVRMADISEIKRYSEELERTNEQLERFAGTVSHDLRNPLNVASGYVEVLLDEIDSVTDPGEIDSLEEWQQHLETVERMMERMDAIIEDVLALSRADEEVIDAERLSLEHVAREAWSTVDTRDASLDVHGTRTLEADPDRLSRLLENLFRNSIDHVGDDVRVTVGLTDDGFFVADDGPGIPSAERVTVFEHGYTTSQNGTGLGLAIVDTIAAAHDWSIELDEDADGTRFVLATEPS